MNKVIQAGIAIISCTVTEILVVGHLMLIVQANHDFMIAGIVSYVIFYIPHCVVDCVIVSEKFFTKRDVVLIVFQNIDKWENTGISTTYVIQLGECCQKLVGQGSREAAVKVERQ